MKPNFSEYIQYYLTDFEWLIILACLWKPFGPKHFLSRYSLQETEQQLQSIKNLPSLDLKIYPLERKHYHRWKDILGTSREGIRVNISCKDREQLLKWLTDYIEHYKNGKIIGIGNTIFKYIKSMENTLNFLDKCENIYGNSIVIAREIDDENGNRLATNHKSRLFEDLFIIGQQGFISFTDITYAYDLLTQNQSKTDIELIQNAKKQLKLSLSILLKEPLATIKAEFLPASTQRTDIPAPYNQFEIKRTNPLDEMTERIYHNGNEVELKPNKQEYRLLHLLVRFARPISYIDIVKNMPFRPHHNREGFLPESNREIEQRFIKNLKNYCSKLRSLLHGVTVTNEHQQIYLR